MLGFKQSPTLLQDIGRSFRFGYFFEAVYRVLDKATKTTDLSPNDKKILQDAIKFLKNVQKGETDVKEGILGSSAIESIGAYRRCLYVFTFGEIQHQNDFQSYIQNLIGYVDRLNKRDRLNTDEMSQLMQFFKKLNVENFKESSHILERQHNRGPKEWNLNYSIIS